MFFVSWRISSLCHWSRKFRQWLTPFSQTIRSKTETNRMVARVFPRVGLLVVLWVLFGLYGWNGPFSLLWFWFYNTRSYSALLLYKESSIWWRTRFFFFFFFFFRFEMYLFIAQYSPKGDVSLLTIKFNNTIWIT